MASSITDVHPAGTVQVVFAVNVCEPEQEPTLAAVANDQVLDAKAEPALFFATTFQKYVLPAFSAVLTTKLVPERFCPYTGGGLLLPRYRSYEVALLDAVQLSVGVVDWLVAPLPGDVSATCPGTNAAVANDQVLDAGADPALFFATTFQK
jgi:hypothetical protein